MEFHLLFPEAEIYITLYTLRYKSLYEYRYIPSHGFCGKISYDGHNEGPQVHCPPETFNHVEFRLTILHVKHAEVGCNQQTHAKFQEYIL